MDSYTGAFTIEPKKMAICYTLFVGVMVLVTLPLMWMDIEGPNWLVWSIRLTLSYILFEIAVMFLRPIALGVSGEVLKAKYLISPQKFLLSDIAGYSRLSYFTRYGIKNSVVLYLKSGRTIEFCEVMMNEISPLIALLEKSSLTYFGVERSYFFTSFPFRRYRLNLVTELK